VQDDEASRWGDRQGRDSRAQAHRRRPWHRGPNQGAGCRRWELALSRFHSIPELSGRAS